MTTMTRITRFLLLNPYTMSTTVPITRSSISLISRCCCTCQLRGFSSINGGNIRTSLSKFGILHPFRRSYQSGSGPMDEAKRKLRMKSTMYYFAALGVITVGASYAAVPLYRIFCAVRRINDANFENGMTEIRFLKS